MDKETYITNFIETYVSCIRKATGISPEISAADYILLRRQAISEYPIISGSMTAYAESRLEEKRVILPEGDPHSGKMNQEQDLNETVSTKMPTDEEELKILLGLGEED